MVLDREGLVVGDLELEHAGHALEHPGVQPRIVAHGRRADGVDADREGRVVEGERPREADHAVLGRDVVREVGERHETRRRADVDDRARAPPDHLAQNRLRAAPDPAQIDVEQRRPLGLGELVGQLTARPDDPGVVDEHVDRAEVCAAAADGRLDLAGVAHVGERGHDLHAETPAALAGDLELLRGAERIRALLDVRADVRQQQVGARAGEGQGRRPADAARGAGDDHRPAQGDVRPAASGVLWPRYSWSRSRTTST